MRETTSAIWSESARDSLIASPNSFIRCFSCWSTNPPSCRIKAVYWMQSPEPPHPLRGILNREIGKIESDDECLNWPETWHCCPGRRKANKGLSDLQRRPERGARHRRALHSRLAAALARDHRPCVPGLRGIWRFGPGEGVPRLSRREGGPEPGGHCRWLYPGVWLVWSKLVLESAKTAQATKTQLACLRSPRRKPSPQIQRLPRTFLCVRSTLHPISRTGIMSGSWAIPEIFPTLAGGSRLCIAGGRGPCGSTRAWGTRKTPTNATSICWDTGRLGFRSRLICRHRLDSIQTIRWRRGKWAKLA